MSKRKPTAPEQTQSVETQTLATQQQPIISSNHSSQPGIVRDLRPRGLKQVKVARALGDGLSRKEAADIVGVSEMAISRWFRTERFKALVARYRDRVEAEVLQSGVALKVGRVRKHARAVSRMEIIMEERAVEMKDIPGGASGLLTRDYKTIGSGENATVHEVYEFDAALQLRYQTALEAIKDEMEPRQLASLHIGDKNTQININYPQLNPQQEAEYAQAKTVDLPPMAKRLLSRPSDGKQI